MLFLLALGQDEGLSQTECSSRSSLSGHCNRSQTIIQVLGRGCKSIFYSLTGLEHLQFNKKRLNAGVTYTTTTPKLACICTFFFFNSGKPTKNIPVTRILSETLYWLNISEHRHCDKLTWLLAWLQTLNVFYPFPTLNTVKSKLCRVKPASGSRSQQTKTEDMDVTLDFERRHIFEGLFPDRHGGCFPRVSGD